ncbi:MAG: hypothetical protein WCG06_01275 [Candidatus Omnitrophota bacterium]
MKYAVLVGSQMSDAPVADMGGRTPIEIAKTPQMDALAKHAQLGCACFVPKDLKAATDVAAMSILGYDPAEFYTGIAPLDALAAGVRLGDRHIAFRCDFVSALDERLVDQTAGRVSAREANELLEAVIAHVADPRFEFHAGGGYKNLLIIKDPELVEDLDEVECLLPGETLDKPITKCLPKGDAAFLLIELMEKAKEILDGHEINRVRIDLGENPANRLWLWGQGKEPKMPSFKQRFGLQGGVCANKDFVRGLAMAAGMQVFDSFQSALKECDLVFVYDDLETPAKTTVDLKTKIRHIEDFDLNVVKSVRELLRAGGEHKLLVTTDVTTSMQTRQLSYQEVPFLITADAKTASGADCFGEKSCAKTDLKVQDGFRLMQHFLGRAG